MPETAEPPASLKALFEVPAASDPVDEQPEEITPPPASPETAAPAAPAAPAAAPAEPKKEEPARMLAPDFTAKPAADPLKTDSAAPVEPVITDAMIEGAKSEKEKADLRNFRKHYEDLKRENQTLKSRPAAADGDADTKALLDRVTKERDEFASRLDRTDLLNSPTFQRDHLKPRDEVYKQAEGIVKEYGDGDTAALRRAYSLQGKARAEALDEVRDSITSDTMRGQFDLHLLSIENMTKVIGEKLNNARQTAEEDRLSRAEQSRNQNKQTEAQWEGLLQETMREFAEKDQLETLIKVDDPNFDWWNKEVDQVQEIARKVLLDSTPEIAAKAAVLAPCAMLFRSMFQAERKARQALESELAEYKGSGPKLTSDGSPPAAKHSIAADADSIIGNLNAGKYRK